MSGLKLVTPPASEPVTLAEAKLHLRVDIADDDALIASYLTASRSICENFLNRSFVATAWRQVMDRFPLPSINTTTGQASLGWSQLNWSPERVYPGTSEPIRVLRTDLIAVSSLTYIDPTGSVQTLDPSQYQVQAGAPGKVVPAYGKTWPAARIQPEAVLLNFTAGYGPDATTTPETVKTALKLVLGLLYYNRDLELSADNLPWTVQALLGCEEWGLYT